jgi:starch phosphorylase
MKLAMNGALTIGTLDGANVEIQAEVGPENVFIFGLTADEIQGLRDGGGYRPRDLYEQNPSVRRIIDALDSGLFCPEEPGLFRWITRAVLDAGDVYFHLADLPAYIATQDRVGGEFEHAAAWASKAILNVARIGRFSSDRTVREYARDIWKIGPVEG